MKKQFKKILKFYNNTTPEQKCQLLNMMAKDIMVPIKKEDGVHCLSLDCEAPICLNGTFFQINTEELYEEERKEINYEKLMEKK